MSNQADVMAAGMGEGTGQLAANNFLIPNGTFFVELIIFLVVLGVIWVFVVPPIRRVLEEREGVVAKTTEDTREATATFAAAETRYREALAEARGEAGRIRDEARAEGQVILDEMRTQAKQQADGIASQAATELRAQGDQIAAELRAGVGPVSQALADRVLGVGETVSGSQAGRG